MAEPRIRWIYSPGYSLALDAHPWFYVFLYHPRMWRKRWASHMGLLSSLRVRDHDIYSLCWGLATLTSYPRQVGNA